MQANDKKLTFADQVNVPRLEHQPNRKVFRACIAVVAAVVVVTAIWVAVMLKVRESEFEASLQKRLDLIAAAQVQVMDALIEAAIAQANRVVDSELFKLYASEVALIKDDVSLLVSGPLPGQGKVSDEITQLSAQLSRCRSNSSPQG